MVAPAAVVERGRLRRVGVGGGKGGGEDVAGAGGGRRTRGTPIHLSLSTRQWWWGSGYPRLRMSALVMTVAPRIHRQYEHVSPWWKSLGGVSLSPRGIRRFFLIRWEAHRKRITAVSSTSLSSTDCNTTTDRLESNPTTATPATVLPVLLQTETSRNGSVDIVKYFSTVDFKGNEDNISGSNC